MKKLCMLFLGACLVLGATMPASAAMVTITFDEAGISAGGGPDPLNPVQGYGDTITNQYNTAPMDWGVQWNDSYANEVTLGEWFNKAFDIGSDNQILWYNDDDVGAVGGLIQLDSPADFISFDYRKPGSSDPIQVKLYSGGGEVYDSGVITASNVWETFSYSVVFDQIWMYSPTDKKFVIDNLAVNLVPIPSALLLLGSGLLPLGLRRLRKREVV